MFEFIFGFVVVAMAIINFWLLKERKKHIFMLDLQRTEMTNLRRENDNYREKEKAAQEQRKRASAAAAEARSAKAKPPAPAPTKTRKPARKAAAKKG